MKTVLLIEDEDNLREFIADSLELFDFKVLKAATAIQGIELAHSGAPDIILCDISLPGMDGYGVLKTLHESPQTIAIPFIFLTARSERDDIRKGMALGADDYITKPFGIDELIESITARLTKHKNSRREIEDIRKQLTVSIPHEFITPLNSVLGFCQLILWTLEDGEQIPPNELEEYVLQIQEGGKRLLHLTQNYVMHAELNVLTAHPPEQRSPQTAKSIITQSVIEQYLKEIPHYNDREHDCVLDIEQATIAISDLYLRKLVSELASNAIKFSLNKTPVVIKGNKSADQKFYILIVHDEGRGMSEDQIKNIGAFVQFERQKYEQQGAGLGLVISKQIADICNSTLHIESHIDHGTTVTVTFPIVTSY